MIGLTESTQKLVVLPVLSATKVVALPQSMQDIQTLKHGKKINLRSQLVQQDTLLMELNSLLNPELLFKPLNNIHEDVVNEREEFFTEMSKFENLKRGQYKVRNRVLPPCPATCRDIDLITRFVI